MHLGAYMLLEMLDRKRTPGTAERARAVQDLNLLTVKQLAQRLRRSESWVYHAKNIPTHRLGGRRYHVLAEVVSWLLANPRWSGRKKKGTA